MQIEEGAACLLKTHNSGSDSNCCPVLIPDLICAMSPNPEVSQQSHVGLRVQVMAALFRCAVQHAASAACILASRVSCNSSRPQTDVAVKVPLWRRAFPVRCASEQGLIQLGEECSCPFYSYLWVIRVFVGLAEHQLAARTCILKQAKECGLHMRWCKHWSWKAFWCTQP